MSQFPINGVRETANQSSTTGKEAGLEQIKGNTAPEAFPS